MGRAESGPMGSAREKVGSLNDARYQNQLKQ
ncbi:hypothetical protein CLV99_2501 [Sphingobacterium yanglingense]|uniref:Uncharacterized protein n=1 Tax=Sphingobacterium yanglingense TaxID=1437280 RepID=A0A4R6WHV0_9SPHI|nr:hypothetical protein CLV99_2501 [Sphingobacterium yanglingense]